MNRTKRMNRTAPIFGAAALLTQLGFGALTLGGCGGTNNPSTGGADTGGTTGGGTGGSPAMAKGTGGTPVTGGSGGAVAVGTGGATVLGTGGTIAAGSGGATTSSTGGAPATTGSGGDPGSSAGGTTGGGTFAPVCTGVPVTAAGVAPTKGGACTATDSQLCYKTCGPQSIGFKSETCTGGIYAEQSGCSFETSMDYSCYKIPASVSATCPATAPQASQPCTVAPCTPCNVAGNYLDSSGAAKAGYCVCPAPGASGASKWSCASATAWPCPAGQGC
jgi:hypothetical protein